MHVDTLMAPPEYAIEPQDSLLEYAIEPQDSAFSPNDKMAASEGSE